MADEEVVEAVEVEPAKEAPKAPEVTAEVAEPELPLAEPEKTEPVAEAEPEKPEEPAPDWKDKELRKKHAQIKDRDRLLAEREKEIEDLRVLAQRPADGKPVPTLSRDEIQREATRIVEQQNYARSLETTNAEGEKAYGKDWTASLETLATFGTVEPDTMRGILGTDAPAKVLYELGKNPAEYQRIMEISDPVRRQTEFVKLSLKTEQKPRPSNAPAPTEPVKARVSPSTDLSDRDSDEAWYAKRAAQRAARQKQRA